MRPILPEMDKINYFSVECWGGATFDSCIRFLDEDPWERLRILRKELPHQKLQMLFRGQNMLGYRPYADDAVEYFVQKSVANGIDVIRIFDALNDPRNLQTAIKAANKEGAHVQGCISYTLSPVHTNEAFAAYAKTLEEMGADSICIKDMAGLLTPYTCYELVKELKAAVKIPVDIHSHYTAGLASMSILKGIEAGADIVDTAMSPLALGTSHMPTESLVAALRGTRLRHRPGPEPAERGPRLLRQAARKVYRQRPDQPQEPGRGRQHPDLPGAGRHVLQYAQTAEGRRQGGTSWTTCWPRSPASARTPAIRRWSLPPARSWAPRPCSTSFWASGTRWSPRSSRA